MKKLGSLNIFKSEEIIAVGDIHGESHKLEKIIKKIWGYLDNPNCHLVFCGDYFDRGVNSPKVYEILCEIRDKKPDQIFFIGGNHEEMLEITIQNKENWWLQWTEKTLDQMVAHWEIVHPDADSDDPDDFYGPFSSWDWMNKKDLEIIEKVCEEKGFIKFLNDLIPYYESDEVICTHAPLNRYACEAFESRTGSLNKVLDNLNLRWTFIKESKPQLIIPKIDKFLICGHQCPREHWEVSPRIFNKRAFIDTGCGLHPDRPLTAFRYPSRKVFQVF